MQVLAHNLAAQFTNRQLNITTDQKGKSAEKLSSGYRINRSADDAAGLSISEEMRRQIRGLNKGGTNIQEGISLCQIADGALGEVTSILQRMRQLSIQAYNGTNSKSDRACIQDEIDNCLDGINEIQERTKYNELYVLKNNGRSDLDGLQKVWVDTSYTVTKGRWIPEARLKPDWLQLNEGKDNTINHFYSDFTQDTNDSGIMLGDFDYDDDQGVTHRVSLYFGDENAKHPENYKWIKGELEKIQNEKPNDYQKLMDANPRLKDYVDHYLNNGNYSGWTSTSTDNVACKIEFGGLVTSTSSVDDLYKNMFNLLGTELGFPCGSCNKADAVRFTGNIPGYKVDSFSQLGGYVSKDTISLTNFEFKCDSFVRDDTDGKVKPIKGVTYKNGYFGAINALRQIDNVKEQNKAAEDLAKVIAEDLTKRVKSSLAKRMQGHYDRVASPNDPKKTTTLYVYDYRDIDALKDPTAPDSKMVNAVATVSTYHTYQETIKDGHYAEIRKGNPSLQIQGSATVGDSIPIELRSISTSSLGLDGYNINSYKREKVYDAQYEADMAEYKRKLENMEYVPVKSRGQYLKMIKAPVIEQSVKYVDGEPIPEEPVEISPAEYDLIEYEVTTWQPKYHLDEPQPSTVEVYNPSDLSILDNAMDQVSKMRSYFGASQNRLEHAYAANKNTEENTTAAESRIRDTDMAEEMVGFSKNNILAQVGQSMLAQANQSTQGILSLLQ